MDLREVLGGEELRKRSAAQKKKARLRLRKFSLDQIAEVAVDKERLQQAAKVNPPLPVKLKRFE